MLAKISKRLKRYALGCVIALTSLAPAFCFAEDNSIANQTVAEVSDMISHGQEFAGWLETNTCNFEAASEFYSVGTHDSMPLRSRTASTFETTMAAIAATATASAGVSVEQLIEPFAMVEPNLPIDETQLAQLNAWWAETQAAANEAYQQLLLSTQQSTATEADPVASEVSSNDDAEFDVVSLVPLVDFDGELNFDDSWATPFASASTVETDSLVVASEAIVPDWNEMDDDSFSLISIDEVPRDHDPLAKLDLVPAKYDLHVFRAEDLIVSETVDAESEYRQTDESPFVGSAPVIASISEVYMPYDFTVQELRVGKLLPRAARPFCICSRLELPGLPTEESHVAPNIPESHDVLDLENGQDADQESLASSQAAVESLREYLWHTQKAIGEDGELREWLRPGAVGQSVANLVVRRDEFVQRMASRLAWVWRNDEPQPPSPAGAELLARAGINTDANAETPTSVDSLKPAERVAAVPDSTSETR